MWENKFTLLQVSIAKETRKFTYLAVCRSTNYLFKFSLNPFNSNIRHSRVSPTGAKTENHKQYISKLLTARVTGSTLGNWEVTRMRSTAVLNQAYALGISTSGKSPGIF